MSDNHEQQSTEHARAIAQGQGAVDNPEARDAAFKRNVEHAVRTMTPEQRQMVADELAKLQTSLEEGGKADPHAELKAREADRQQQAETAVANGRLGHPANVVMPDADRYENVAGKWRVYLGMVNGHPSHRWLAPEELDAETGRPLALSGSIEGAAGMASHSSQDGAGVALTGDPARE